MFAWLTEVVLLMKSAGRAAKRADDRPQLAPAASSRPTICAAMTSRTPSNIDILRRLRTLSPKPSSGIAAGRAELADHAVDQVGRGRRRIGKPVIERQCLPLEGPQLME